MVKRLGVIAEMETTPLAVAVTGAPGGAGAALDHTQASSSVSITNTSNGAALEYKAGTAVWVKIQPSDGVELAIDLATTALAFRRARYDGGLASVSLVIAGKPTLKSAEGGLPIASGSATAATLTGTFAIGQTITAKLPDGVVGTLQFTRTLVAAPFTKSAISGAVANAVNSLAYTLTNADGGYAMGADASNHVTPSATINCPPTVVADALASDVFEAYSSFEPAMPFEPQRLDGIIKNTSSIPIYVAENNDINHQKNRTGASLANGPSATTTVQPGDEYFTDSSKMTYVRTAAAITAASAEYDEDSGLVTIVTATAHGLTDEQSNVNIFDQNFNDGVLTIPAEYNTPYPGVVTAYVVDAHTFLYVPVAVPSGPATVQPAIQSLASITVERRVLK